MYCRRTNPFFQRKIIVKLLLGSDTNFDKHSLSGSSLLASRVYKQFDEYKTVFINMNEFSNINNHLKKINHLVAKGIVVIEKILTFGGIESNNINGVYDFSSIGNIEQPHPEEVDKGIIFYFLKS